MKGIEVYDGDGKTPSTMLRLEAENITVQVPSPLQVDTGRIFLTGITTEMQKEIEAIEVGMLAEFQLHVLHGGKVTGFTEFGPRVIITLKHIEWVNAKISGTIHWIKEED